VGVLVHVTHHLHHVQFLWLENLGAPIQVPEGREGGREGESSKMRRTRTYTLTKALPKCIIEMPLLPLFPSNVTDVSLPAFLPSLPPSLLPFLLT
jgi:hypothetical protein